jgi:tripartite-type tricarboxylate transporter receptor subunit TctC
MTPDEFAKYVTDDVAKWQKVIQVSGAKPDR